MIYERPSPDDPVRQGDIFRNVPRIDVSLGKVLAFDEQEGAFEARWVDLVDRSRSQPIQAAVRIMPVQGIVITQDCDALRSRDISLCEIRPFREVYPHIADMKDTPRRWIGVITQHARANYGWFYLPKDPNIGFTKRMGTEFGTVLRVARKDLESMRTEHRVARLNQDAVAHFRERLSDFFRRYPYNEWYPLTKEEFETYKTEKGPVEPYPWQK